MANILLTKNEENTIIMTLSERVTISNPTFLFHFQSKFNKSEERFFNSANLSNNKIRYDEFKITETSTPDYPNSKVDLYTGEWKYDVYEATGSTLNISGTTGNVLQTGMAIIIDENYK